MSNKRAVTALISLGGIALAGATALALGLHSPARQQAGTVVTFGKAGPIPQSLPYYPIPIALAKVKPQGITKEPAYTGTPLYGTIHLGNGPKATYTLVLDEPASGDFKIYIDKNQNGDLTDDGTGAWSTHRTVQARTIYGPMDVPLRASYGTTSAETGSGDYTVSFYRIVGIQPLLMYRKSARTGTIAVGAKTVDATLVENDADALYSKPMDDNGKPITGDATRPVWLMLSDGGNGKPAMIDVRAPFDLNGHVYEAHVAPDGSKLTLAATTRVAYKPKEPVQEALLSAGTAAPNFAANAWSGGKLQLAQYRGKIVLLDFWSTWCGPCQRSMPHLEKVYKQVKSQNVVAVALCSWDDLAAYKSWVPAHKTQYDFTFAFDPAGKDNAKAIAGSLYKVSGIPTTYIIDRNGKVAASVVGYDDGDNRIEKALQKLGVKVKS